MASASSRKRLLRALLVVAFALAFNACEDGTEATTACSCAAPTLSVVVPEGTTLDVAEGGCTASCPGTASKDCTQVLVSSDTEQTCTLRATAKDGGVETSTVTFTDRGCCRLGPDRMEWRVGR